MRIFFVDKFCKNRINFPNNYQSSHTKSYLHFMIIDLLSNAEKYYNLDTKIFRALQYLQTTNFSNIEKGKYEVEANKIFALVNEYKTVNAATNQMESHLKFIDVQFIVTGEELIGHGFLANQTISKKYDKKNDYMLYADAPQFFSKFTAGMFAIFYPTDLHMPNLQVNKSILVKKVVLKVAVS